MSAFSRLLSSFVGRGEADAHPVVDEEEEEEKEPVYMDIEDDDDDGDEVAAASEEEEAAKPVRARAQRRRKTAPAAPKPEKRKRSSSSAALSRSSSSVSLVISKDPRFEDIPAYVVPRGAPPTPYAEKLQKRSKFFTEQGSPGVKGLLLSHSRVHAAAMDFRHQLLAASSEEPATPLEAIAALNGGRLTVSAEWMTAVRSVLTAYLQEVLSVAHTVAEAKRGQGKGLSCGKSDVETAFGHVDTTIHGEI